MNNQISICIMDNEHQNVSILDNVPFSSVKFYLQIISDFLTDSNIRALSHIEHVVVDTRRKSTIYEIHYDNKNVVMIKIKK